MAILICSIILILCGHKHVSSEVQEVFDIMPTGNYDNTSFFILENLQIGNEANLPTEAENFTLSFWVFIRLFNTLPTVISYAVSTYNDNALSIAVPVTKIIIDIRLISAKVHFSMEPRKWYHLSVVKNLTTLFFYINSKALATFSIPNNPLLLNGTLVLGQDQDHVGGGFITSQAFSGKISALSFYLSALNQSDLSKIMNFTSQLQPDLLKGSTAPWIEYGNVNRTTEDIKRTTIEIFFIPQKHSFNSLEKICLNMNMTVFAPVSDDEIGQVTKILHHVPESCRGVYLNERMTWLGGIQRDTCEWFDPVRGLDIPINTSLTSSLVYSHEIGNLRIIFSEFGRPGVAGTYRDGYCGLCTQYSIDTQSVIYLRGLCSETYDDVLEFYPRTNEHSSLILVDSTGLIIHLLPHGAELLHFPSNRTVASTMSTNIWGNHKWTICILKTHCLKMKYDSPFDQLKDCYEDTLILSNCENNQFPCGDGFCQPMEKRCSHGLDCTDGTDEEECSLIHNIVPTTIPPPVDPLPMEIQLNVMILSVDIVKQIVQLNFDLTIVWNDPRIQFKNLMYSNETFVENNLIPEDQVSKVWTPTIKILNEERIGRTASVDRMLLILRNGPPKRILKDYIYEGSQNPLRYHLESETKIHCKFDLQFFPFDQHYCQLRFMLTNIYAGRLKFSTADKTLSSLSDQSLNEYKSTNACISFTHNMISYNFYLSRQMTFHLFSTYFPTMLMHAIGFGTLFISADDFQDRGAFSLTTLLVLISLYSDTLVTLPATSYLKHIDIWFIFSFTFLSIVIAVHIATNNGPKEGGTKVAWAPKNKTAFILKKARLFMGTGYLMFFIIYWSFFLVHKYYKN